MKIHKPTKDIHNKSVSEYIDKISNGTISPKVGDYIKGALKEVLKDPNHGKHDFFIKLLRDAKNSSLNKKFSSYTLGGISKLSEIGISDDTIIEILETFRDSRLNYRNTLAKIASYGKLQLNSDKTYGYLDQDIKLALDSGLGSTCEGLSIFFLENFMTKNLSKKISEETGQIVSIQIYTGRGRECFNQKGDLHIFCLLDIGNIFFCIDPSFGELSLLESNQYILIRQSWNGDTSANLKYLSSIINTIKINPIIRKEEEGRVFIEGAFPYYGRFLGKFFNTEYLVVFGYGVDQEDHVLPMIQLYKPGQGTSKIIRCFLDNGVLIDQNNNLPSYLEEKVQKTFDQVAALYKG